MPPAKVVEAVDVVTNRVLRLTVRREENAGEQLVNQRTEETLGNGLLTSNPFQDYDGRPIPTDPNHYVSMGAFNTLAKKAPSEGWRAMLGLCRLAGLRRGEALALPWESEAEDREGVKRWIGVDFRRMRVCVVSIKTQMYREIPMSRQLAKILRAAQAENGSETVTGLSGHNMTRHAAEIAEAAELDVWPKFYQAMRSSCENDWKQRGIAEPTYTAWLGHSPTVSRKHYVAPTEAEFRLVTGAA